MSCAEWVKLIVAYRAGQSSQAATDQKAAQQEATNALETRAKLDDQVQRTSGADVTRELSEWERPGG